MSSDNPDADPIVNEQGTFRRLNANERVLRGDWILNEQQELSPWEGPTGFQASSFEHPVYRIVTEEPTSSETDPT